MRDAFYGHYPLSEGELGQLWLNATIVLDTNALLNLYRYSPKARMEFLEALTNVADRLWLPHQVGMEFHANRVARISEQLAVDDAILAALDDVEKVAKGKLGQFNKNAFVTIDDLVDRIVHAVERGREHIRGAKAERSDSYGITLRSDPILDQLATIFQSNVGEGYASSEMAEIRKVCDQRYALDVPPGYKDRAKEGDRKYGDYLIWRQMLDYAKTSGNGIVFVTDDNKEDWWWIVKGDTVGRQILGPRPELREEFRIATGQLFYMYSPEEFLKNIYSITKTDVSTDVVAEVGQASRDAEESMEGAASSEEDFYEIAQIESLRTVVRDEIRNASRRIDELSAMIDLPKRKRLDAARLAEELDSTSVMRSALAAQLRNSRERLHKHGAGGGKAAEDLAEMRRIERVLHSVEQRRSELLEGARSTTMEVESLDGMSFESVRHDLESERQRLASLDRDYVALDRALDKARRRLGQME
ncbi:PIN domain-containing protein [Saccharothrix sp. NPDC042600]|uniref:PIN domain-containing protein n=1 Tax=Saccharothrix TaxID=2071 RepID=UPI0033CD9E43|nr:hypothetical protein GCM10017745_88570 [Saccharothrix mutabilis subsp. capreolus]